jgi:hypothetical protein
VSHQHERKEKDCLNCGATVAGRYCQNCGQENVETKETFWSLATHFIYDILHFDGKFFYTLKYLFTKPGFVAGQYAKGKRAFYLHPIRMYLFTSAVFFLVFFSVGAFNIGKGKINGTLDEDDRRELANVYSARLQKNPSDTFLRPRIALLLDSTRRLPPDSLSWLQDAEPSGMKINKRQYASLSQYDSVQAALPPEKKDNWIPRAFARQAFKSRAKYGNSSEVLKSLLETFLHRLPYMLFLSLPFFAGLLKLLYIRRKNFLYSDHAVFTLYHYVFSFILLLAMIGVNALANAFHWEPLSYLTVILGFTWPVYLFLEMRRFYGQSGGKIFLKFVLLNILGFFLILILFFAFFVFSFFQS